jgi:thiol-disulfide isomerase/thioredoxin
VRALIGIGIVAIAAAGGFIASQYWLQNPPAAPQYLPELTLPDLEGKPRALSEWKGRPLLINFWATWCEPCRKEIPLLRELRARHAAQGLEVIGIAIDFRDPVAAYARQTGIEYPLLIAEQNGLAPRMFGIGSGIPVSIFVNRNGRITATKPGTLHAKRAAELLQPILQAP